MNNICFQKIVLDGNIETRYKDFVSSMKDKVRYRRGKGNCCDHPCSRSMSSLPSTDQTKLQPYICSRSSRN